MQTNGAPCGFVQNPTLLKLLKYTLTNLPDFLLFKVTYFDLICFNKIKSFSNNFLLIAKVSSSFNKSAVSLLIIPLLRKCLLAVSFCSKINS